MVRNLQLFAVKEFEQNQNELEFGAVWDDPQRTSHEVKSGLRIPNGIPNSSNQLF